MLVDTNVLSELTRPTPHAGVLAWAARIHALTIRAITLEELRYGARVRGSTRLSRTIDAILAQAEVLPVTARIAERAADLRAARRAKGRPVTQADMLIAATALEHGGRLATRNTRDFEGLGVELVDPFRS